MLDGLRRFASLPLALADFGPSWPPPRCEAGAATARSALGELPGFLQDLRRARVALVFGPEKSGLTEEEMSHASVFLRLPTVPDFPDSERLARRRDRAGGDPARRGRRRRGPAGALATANEIEGAIGHWNRALDAIGFYDTGHQERTLRDWRRIVAGRPLSERDVKILRGVANRVLVSLRRKEKRDS